MCLGLSIGIEKKHLAWALENHGQLLDFLPSKPVVLQTSPLPLESRSAHQHTPGGSHLGPCTPQVMVNLKKKRNRRKRNYQQRYIGRRHRAR